MRPPSLAEAGRALSGVLGLMERDAGALARIDTSVTGTLRSFLVYLWCWPAQAFLWTGIWRDLPDSRPETVGGTLRFFAVGSLFDVFSWILPALILLPVSRMFDFRARYLPLVAASNWFALVATYLAFLPATVKYFAPVPDGIAGLMSLAVYGLTLGFYFRMARVILGGEALLAALVVLISLMSSLLLSSLAFSTLSL
ncbi:hypothetical protein [Pseudohoeflea coraliihabitans]|uniref:Uncharacterized protein n=1 Tax=Pseudohoeflea coraliihabitans TaxID=2860393 RepID=A0ABS6WPL5_9HYPH|nr:hypothetical protein [Pseudohoeflea sp. DP4N28-3]MBW3097578.1 hypothetical protein [Pseudohoeflea sp. DP4N28-3]